MAGVALSSGGLTTARSPPLAGAVRAMGLAGLAASVAAALWLAVGASEGGYLLELPSGTAPLWIDGPLHGLGSAIALGPGSLSAGMLVLGGGYLLALSCAASIRLRWALVAVVLANLAFTLGPTIVSTDVFGYIAYARELALHGHNPYISEPISLGGQLLRYVYWKHQPSPYGPLFTLASAPLGLLSPSCALWLLKVVAGAASIAIAALVADVARRRGMNAARAAIFVGLNPLLLLYAVSGAHNDLLAALLLVVAIALMTRGRDGGAGAAALAAAAVKLTVGLALPFIVVGAHRRGRASWGAALAAVAIGVPALLLFGPSMFGQLHRISTDPLFDTTFSGPDRLASMLGSSIDTAVRVACAAAALMLALTAFVRALRGADAIAAAGWALLALLASIASLAPWYVVWLLPFAALGRSRRLAIATLLVSGYLLAVHMPALGGLPWLSQPRRSTLVTVTQARGPNVPGLLAREWLQTMPARG